MREAFLQDNHSKADDKWRAYGNEGPVESCSSPVRASVNPWKQPKCPWTDEWIKKMWYIYTIEYYSAIEKNKILPFAATWMDLEIIILHEVSQTEKDKYDIT